MGSRLAVTLATVLPTPPPPVGLDLVGWTLRPPIGADVADDVPDPGAPLLERGGPLR